MVGKYPRTQAIREERRARAEEVNERNGGLTFQERLAKLDARGFVAMKERAKIHKQIEAAKKTPPAGKVVKISEKDVKDATGKAVGREGTYKRAPKSKG